MMGICTSRILAVFVGIGTVSGAHAADRYLCLPDHSVGFGYDERSDSWHPQIFNTHEKYIIRPLTALEQKIYAATPPVKDWRPTHGVFETGMDFAWSTCKEPELTGYWQCEGLAKFYFNETILRFELVFLGSYIWAPRRGMTPDTPAMLIGKCSPL